MADETDNNVPYDWRKDPWHGWQYSAENRNKPENLAKLAAYAGQVVAWYPDGSDIWGADQDMYALWQRLEAAGENPSLYLLEQVPPPGLETFIGGIWDMDAEDDDSVPFAWTKDPQLSL
jgi:hypothetical protein